MAFSYQELSEHAGLNSDGVSGFEAQVATGKLRLEAVWPAHLTGKRVDDFRRGSELARAWMNMRKGVASARRSVRAEERRTIGIMYVYAATTAAELKQEQLEALKMVVKTSRDVDAIIAAESAQKP